MQSRAADSGIKIETLWPDDGTWYSATVQSFDSSTSKHELLYDEGTVEEIDLSTLGEHMATG